MSTAAFFPPLRWSNGVAPRAPINPDPAWPAERQALCRVYNRLGGLIARLAADKVEVPAVLAVWYVESSGQEHVPGQAVIRFENHLLFRIWGESNAALYDAHFQHGGRPPATGDACRGSDGEFASWLCHAYRVNADQPFVPAHRGQPDEYAELALARSLAGDDAALQCVSYGGPQILGLHYRELGFKTPREMYDAFQASEAAQVAGFFGFCEHCGKPGEAIGALGRRDWAAFARAYNGSGNVAAYAEQMQRAYDEAAQLF